MVRIFEDRTISQERSSVW